MDLPHHDFAKKDKKKQKTQLGIDVISSLRKRQHFTKIGL